MRKVLVLFGGNSSEHSISCLSAKSILENIDRQLFDVTSVGISPRGEWYVFDDDFHYLENASWLKVSKNKKIQNIVGFLKTFDVVFPIMHGTNGEDGKLQGMLDLFSIRYVGSKTLSSAVGMDKEFSKILFDSVGIPQVPYISFSTPSCPVRELEMVFHYPMIVKPANGGSSIGISKVNNKKQLVKAVKIASNYDDKIIVEKFINARELECAILDGKKKMVSDVGEIIASKEFYDFEAKYQSNESQILLPASIPKEIAAQIKEYALLAYSRLGARGLARVDFFYVEEENQIYLNEINTIPGFTTISMYPKLWMHKNYTYSQLITTLINNA